jgi:hypothetical protein
MKKLFTFSIIGFSLIVYFSLAVFVLPEKYLSNEQLTPQPYFEVEVSNSEISLGESFRLNIVSENRGDYGDIHIVSTAFPDLQQITDVVEIYTYDFTQSPVYLFPGDEVDAKYSGGLQSTPAEYPSIKATSRPIHPNSKYHLDLVITPEKSGTFSTYVKSIDIPHTSNLSHYPDTGVLDHQNEYVQVYTVIVNP